MSTLAIILGCFALVYIGLLGYTLQFIELHGRCVT